MLDYKREMHEKVVWPTDQPNKEWNLIQAIMSNIKVAGLWNSKQTSSTVHVDREFLW